MSPTAEVTSTTLEARMARVEWATQSFEKAIADRLTQGAEHFRKIDARLDEAIEAARPKPKTWQIVTFGFAVITFVAALIWQAARYPDRTEFDRAVSTMHSETAALAHTVNTMQTDAIIVGKTVETIQKSQDRAERSYEQIRDKLDVIIAADRAARPRR